MSRFNLVLAFVFLVLLSVLLALENPFAGDAYDAARRRQRALFPGFDGAKAAKVELRTKDKGIVIERAPDGTWVIPASHGYPAKATGEGNSVQDLFSRLRRIRVGEPLSVRPEAFDTYNVGEGGMLIRVSDASGASLAEFRQGRFAGLGTASANDPDFERKFNFSVYLRRTDSSEVFLVDSFLPFGLSPEEWLENSLVRFDPATAVSFSVEGPALGGRVSLAKEGDAWRLVEPAPGPARAAIVEEWLNGFAFSFFKDVVAKGEDPAKFNLAEPVLTARAKTADGKEYGVRFAAGPDPTAYYAVRDGDPTWVFLVASHVLEKLKTRAERFSETPASAPSSPTDSAPASAPASVPAPAPAPR